MIHTESGEGPGRQREHPNFEAAAHGARSGEKQESRAARLEAEMERRCGQRAVAWEAGDPVWLQSSGSAGTHWSGFETVLLV